MEGNNKTLATNEDFMCANTENKCIHWTLLSVRAIIKH